MVRLVHKKTGSKVVSNMEISKNDEFVHVEIVEDLPGVAGYCVVFNGTSGFQKGPPVLFFEFGSLNATENFFK